MTLVWVALGVAVGVVIGALMLLWLLGHAVKSAVGRGLNL